MFGEKVYFGPYSYLLEAVSESDKKVILSFLNEKPASNNRLETDGEVLNGLWSGGKNIAWWEDDKPVYREPTTKTEEEIVKQLKKLGGPVVKSVNESSLSSVYEENSQENAEDY